MAYAGYCENANGYSPRVARAETRAGLIRNAGYVGQGAAQVAIAGRPAQIRQFMIGNRYDRNWSLPLSSWGIKRRRKAWVPG